MTAEQTTATRRRSRRPYTLRMPAEARREQLMDVALALIDEHGITGVSVDAVAKRAGVSRTVVYGVFEDSDHILREVLKREEVHAIAVLSSLVPSEPGTDAVAALTGIFTGLLEEVRREPRRWRTILLPADGQPGPVHRRIERGYATLLEFTTGFVKAAAEQAGTELDDIELATRLIQNHTIDTARLLLRDPDAYPPERLLAFADNLLYRLFVPQPLKQARQ